MHKHKLFQSYVQQLLLNHMRGIEFVVFCTGQVP